jgi:hypothetical protein
VDALLALAHHISGEGTAGPVDGDVLAVEVDVRSPAAGLDHDAASIGLKLIW